MKTSDLCILLISFAMSPTSGEEDFSGMDPKTLQTPDTPSRPENASDPKPTQKPYEPPQSQAHQLLHTPRLGFSPDPTPTVYFSDYPPDYYPSPRRESPPDSPPTSPHFLHQDNAQHYIPYPPNTHPHNHPPYQTGTDYRHVPPDPDHRPLHFRNPAPRFYEGDNFFVREQPQLRVPYQYGW